MDKPMGVVTRFREHAQHFSPAFWETKDVGGARRRPEPGTIPMVSCFGDNRVAKRHPDWVQLGPGGARGTRDARYFDWDTLCPSRPEVFELALGWVAEALEDAPALRLDDVTFARQGYCTCTVCQQGANELGMTAEAWRQHVLVRFVTAVRERVGSRPLYLTLYPDPYPGHLERDYGLALDQLKLLVDAFVVPLYDLHYGTTYWLEILARGFRDRLAGHPWWAEVYALSVPTPQLAKAAQVVGAYADGVLLAYGADRAALDEVVRIARGEDDGPPPAT